MILRFPACSHPSWEKVKRASEKHGLWLGLDDIAEVLNQVPPSVQFLLGYHGGGVLVCFQRAVPACNHYYWWNGRALCPCADPEKIAERMEVVEYCVTRIVDNGKRIELATTWENHACDELACFYADITVTRIYRGRELIYLNAIEIDV